MENLTYITGNYGKYISVKEKFENAGITIDYFKCDLDEPDINDIELIKELEINFSFVLNAFNRKTECYSWFKKNSEGNHLLSRFIK